MRDGILIDYLYATSILVFKSEYRSPLPSPEAEQKLDDVSLQYVVSRAGFSVTGMGGITWGAKRYCILPSVIAHSF